jgi:hypothetical protein
MTAAEGAAMASAGDREFGIGEERDQPAVGWLVCCSAVWPCGGYSKGRSVGRLVLVGR